MHKSESKNNAKFETSIYYSYNSNIRSNIHFVHENIALFLTKCCFSFTYIHGLFLSGANDAITMVTYNILVKLKSSPRRFYGRHYDLVDRSEISVPQMTTDMFHLSYTLFLLAIVLSVPLDIRMLITLWYLHTLLTIKQLQNHTCMTA
jgi:hypothetical protein